MYVGTFQACPCAKPLDISTKTLAIFAIFVKPSILKRFLNLPTLLFHPFLGIGQRTGLVKRDARAMQLAVQ